MREIKYKAYWHDSKLMTTVDTIEFLNSGTRVSDGCMHTGWLGKDCELLQYIGLKDINGTHVFEGDILEHKYFDDGLEKSSVAVMEYDDNCDYDYGGRCFGFDINGFWGEDITVIGNRYENPDLLGGTS